MPKAFSRAIAMSIAIAGAMKTAGNNYALLQSLLQDIGPYESRGHGKSRGAKWLGGSQRSKYMPHFGKKQQAKLARRNVTI